MHADTLTTVLHLARALLEGGGAGRLVDRVRAEQLALEAYEGFGTLHRQQPEHSDIADAKELLSRLRAEASDRQKEELEPEPETEPAKLPDGLLELEHARCHCFKVQFVRLEPEDKDYPSGSVADRQTNSRHCDKCFCWVCDRIATQCSQWEQHCMAVDSHQHWQREQKLRKAAQAAKT
jgi:hypothetical protein